MWSSLILNLIGNNPVDFWYFLPLIPLPFWIVIFWSLNREGWSDRTQSLVAIGAIGSICTLGAFLLLAIIPVTGFPIALIWLYSIPLSFSYLLHRRREYWSAVGCLVPWGIWLARPYWPEKNCLDVLSREFLGGLFFLIVISSLLLFFGFKLWIRNSNTTQQSQKVKYSTSKPIDQTRVLLGTICFGLFSVLLISAYHFFSHIKIPLGLDSLIIGFSGLSILGYGIYWGKSHSDGFRFAAGIGLKVSIIVLLVGVIFFTDAQAGYARELEDCTGPSFEDAIATGVMVFYNEEVGAFQDQGEPTPSIESTHRALEILNVANQSPTLSASQKLAMEKFILDAREWVELKDTISTNGTTTNETIEKIKHEIIQINWWETPTRSVLALRCLDLLDASDILIETLTLDVEEKIMEKVGNLRPFSINDGNFIYTLAAAYANSWGLFSLMSETNPLGIGPINKDHLTVKDKPRIEFADLPNLDRTFSVPLSEEQTLTYQFMTDERGFLVDVPLLRDLLPNWDEVPAEIYSLAPPKMSIKMEWDFSAFPNLEPEESPVWGENGSLIHPDWLEYSPVTVLVVSEDYINEELVDLDQLINGSDDSSINTLMDYVLLQNESLADAKGATFTIDGELVQDRTDNYTTYQHYAAVLAEKDVPAHEGMYQTTLDAIPRGPIRVIMGFEQIVHQNVEGENDTWTVVPEPKTFEMPINLTINIPAYGLFSMVTPAENIAFTLHMEESPFQYGGILLFPSPESDVDWREVITWQVSRTSEDFTNETVNALKHRVGNIYQGIGFPQTSWYRQECWCLMESDNRNNLTFSSVDISTKNSRKISHEELFEGLDLINSVFNASLEEFNEIHNQLFVASQMVSSPNLLLELCDELFETRRLMLWYDPTTGLFGRQNRLDYTAKALEGLKILNKLEIISLSATPLLNSIFNDYLVFEGAGEDSSSCFLQNGRPSLGSTWNAFKIVTLVDSLGPQYTTSDANLMSESYVGKMLEFEAYEEEQRTQEMAVMQEDKTERQAQQAAMEALTQATAWIVPAVLQEGDKDEMYNQEEIISPTISGIDFLMDIDKFPEVELPWEVEKQFQRNPLIFLLIIWMIAAVALYSTDPVRKRVILAIIVPGFLVGQNWAVSYEQGEQTKPIARQNRLTKFVRLTAEESVHYMSTTLQIASDIKDALFYVSKPAEPYLKFATRPEIVERPTYRLDDYMADLKANYSQSLQEVDHYNALGGTVVPKPEEPPSREFITLDYYNRLYEPFKEMYGKEFENDELSEREIDKPEMSSLNKGKVGSIDSFLNTGKKVQAGENLAANTIFLSSRMVIERLQGAMKRFSQHVRKAVFGTGTQYSYYRRSIIDAVEQFNKRFSRFIELADNRLKSVDDTNLIEIRYFNAGEDCQVVKQVSEEGILTFLAELIESSDDPVKTTLVLRYFTETLGIFDDLGPLKVEIQTLLDQERKLGQYFRCEGDLLPRHVEHILFDLIIPL